MKRLLIALLFAASCVPAAARIYGYQFAPAYRPGPPPRPATVLGDYRRIRTVAVLSGLGDLELAWRSPTGQRTSRLAIAAWSLDDRAEAVVRQTLKARFRFVRVDYDHRALAAMRTDRLTAFLRTVAAADADALIVIRPNAASGLALQTTANRDTILWADFVVDVIDSRSLQTIAHAAARIEPPGDARSAFPGRVVGHDYILDRTLTIAPATTEALRPLANELLAAALSETVIAMGLAKP
jgi:hypothetical protein